MNDNLFMYLGKKKNQIFLIISGTENLMKSGHSTGVVQLDFYA